MGFGAAPVTALTAITIDSTTLFPCSKASARNEIPWSEVLLGVGANANTFTSQQVFLTGAAGASPVVIRQTGGTAGVDELQIAHNGTDTIFNIPETGATAYSFRTNGVERGRLSWDTAFPKFSLGSSGFCLSARFYNAAQDTGIDLTTNRVVALTANTFLVNTGGRSRIDNADVINNTTTPTNITGLSATLLAGRKYTGEMVLFVDEVTSADGLRLDFDGGTATMTRFIAQGLLSDDNGFQSIGRSTALATDLTDTTIQGSVVVIVKISMVVNAAGTFIPRFAKEADAGGAALTATIGSYMWLEDTP